MGRVASGKYVYKPGDHKHLYTRRECAYCGAEYLGRVDNNSRFCSLRCSGKATGRQPRPTASRAGYLICVKCGAEKPEDEFARWSRSPTGRKPRCKACRAEDWQATKTPESMARMREAGRRWQAENRERTTAKMRRWRAANPLAARAIGHRRRVRKHSSTIVAITAAALADKWNFWGGRCWMCGDEATQIDHVKPLAKGGAHILSNLRPACVRCNRRKRDRWPYQPEP